MNKKVPLTIILLLTILTLVSACGSPKAPTATPVPSESVQANQNQTPEIPSTETPKKLIIVRVGHVIEPDRIDSQYGAAYTSLLWDSMEVSFDTFGRNNGEFIPRLAQKVDVSEDGKTFTIHLFDGITWDDGTPLDADYLVKYWDWVKNISVSGWYPATANAVSYQALDRLTFQLTLSKPDGGFFGNDDQYLEILPLSVYGKFNEDQFWAFSTDKPVTTGPLTVTEWKRGSYIILDTRENYHLGRPNFDRAIWQFYNNYDALVQALLAGEIDVIPTSIPAVYVDQLKADPKITVAETSPGTIMGLFFNMSSQGKQNPAILDQKVREAIDYAINRQQIIDVTLVGHGTICPPRWRCGPFRQDLQDPTITATPYDAEQANRILNDAGYLDINNDGFRETLDGKPLSFRLQYDVTFPPIARATEMVQQNLQSIGLKTELEMVEHSTLLNSMMGDENYDIAIAQVGQDPGPFSFYDWRLSCWSATQSSGGNLTNYCSKDFDNLLDKVGSSFGEEAKQAVFAIDHFYATERPFINIAGINQIGAYRNDRLEMDTDLYPDYSYLWGWWNVMHLKVK